MSRRLPGARARGMALLLAGAPALALAAAPELGGELQLDLVSQRAAALGPLAAAHARLPGFVPYSGLTLRPTLQLRASADAAHAVVSLRHEARASLPDETRATVHELYAAGGQGGWQFTAGRRIVSWDVGEGFRPNDIVQQEPRRPLVPTLVQGRTVLMAEHFDADTAWSALVVNPQNEGSARNAAEPALAARFYRRDGERDWHGFARWGRRTQGSLGGALAWVLGDAVELHGSARWLSRHDTLSDGDTGTTSTSTPLRSSNPWQAAQGGHATQALLGASWTGTSHLSVLGEAWWDGTAPSAAQWRAWQGRNAALVRLGTVPTVPALAVAGNLAWQAQAFQAAGNLHRSNLFARISARLGDWEPSASLLYTPADAGRVATAALTWQGNALRVEGGLRVNGGPSTAVLSQLPTRQSVYLTGSWRF